MDDDITKSLADDLSRVLRVPKSRQTIMDVLKQIDSPDARQAIYALSVGDQITDWSAFCLAILHVDILGHIWSVLQADGKLQAEEKRFMILKVVPFLKTLLNMDKDLFGRIKSVTTDNVQNVMERFAFSGCSVFAGLHGFHAAAPICAVIEQLSTIEAFKDYCQCVRQLTAQARNADGSQILNLMSHVASELFNPKPAKRVYLSKPEHKLEHLDMSERENWLKKLPQVVRRAITLAREAKGTQQN